MNHVATTYELATLKAMAALTHVMHRGFSIFPVEGKEQPLTQHGHLDATSDEAQIRKWWAKWPNANIGIATGASGIAVIDVDPGGEAALTAWQEKNGRLPWTWTARSGSGGRHIYFKAPAGVELHPGINIFGPDSKVDKRVGSSYVIGAGSQHPNGNYYQWHRLAHPINTPLAELPDALLAHLRTGPSTANGERQTVADIPRTIYEGEGRDTALYRYLSNMRRFATESEMLAAANAFNADRCRPPLSQRVVEQKVRSAMKHDPDPDELFRETNAAASAPSTSAAEPPDWAEIDLAAFRNAEPLPGPTMLPRADGVRLFYDDKLHWISGEPEGLKSWLAQIACADAITDGQHVIYIDFEDGPASVTDRLVNLGASWEAILTYLHYFRPETPMDRKGISHVLTVAEQHPPALAVLDGVNASMGANDLDPNSARDFYKWWQKLGAPLRKLTPGATVCIDHVVKNEENRKQYAAGTGQKLAAVDVHYGIEVTDPFGIGLTGRATISLLKDRPGMVQIHAGKRVQGRAPVGKLVMKSDPEAGEIRFQIEPQDVAAAGGFRPTHLMEEVSKYVGRGHDGPIYKTTIIEGVPGKNAAVRVALDLLLQEGYLIAVPQGRFTGILEAKKYRAAEDKVSGERFKWPLRRAGNSDCPRPSQTVPDGPENRPSHRPTPKGDGARRSDREVRKIESPSPGPGLSVLPYSGVNLEAALDAALAGVAA